MLLQFRTEILRNFVVLLFTIFFFIRKLTVIQVKIRHFLCEQFCIFCIIFYHFIVQIKQLNVKSISKNHILFRKSRLNLFLENHFSKYFLFLDLMLLNSTVRFDKNDQNSIFSLSAASHFRITSYAVVTDYS